MKRGCEGQEAAALRKRIVPRTAAGAEKRIREECKGPSALSQIAERVGAEGPFSLLRRCLLANTRVRVVTRHAVGIRGVATGGASMPIPCR